MSPEASVTKRKGIFPGWLMVMAGSLMTWWGAGIFMYSFGNYLKPLINEFGWSRAQVSLASSFARLDGGLEGPFAGIATDKWGPRVVNLIGFTVLGAGFMMMYYVNSLLMFYVVWVITASGYNFGMMRPLDAALANWFVRRRGLTVGIMRLGMSSAGLTVVPLTMFLLLQYDWRDAFLYLGVATIFIGGLLTWFFIKPRRPEYYGWLPDGKRVEEEIAADTEATIRAGVEYAAEKGEVEFTVKQALRDRTWWVWSIAMGLNGMVFPAISLHTVPYLTDIGIDPMFAAGIFGTTIFLRGPGAIFFGWLGDRVPLRRLRYLLMLGHFVEALSLFVLIKATNMAWVWVFIVLYGLGSGATMGVSTPLRGRYWGRKAFATIQGMATPFLTVLGMIGPVYAGWAYDTTGSYMGAFGTILIFALASTTLLFFATPPKPPKVVTGITDVV